MISLRDYQEELKANVYNRWQTGFRNVLAVAPTGAGKTRIKSAILAECKVPSIAIAHRQELVGQISLALAESGVVHNIIGPENVIRFCVKLHVDSTGRSFYHRQSPVAVAGVDTLIRRGEEIEQWCKMVQIWDIDEAHHVLRGNKWGKALAMFPNAWGLGFTATPERCDKKTLGAEGDGVFHDMVLGPTPRELIDRGYLSDYKLFCPKPSIQMTAEDIGSTGDYKADAIRKKAHKSTITGDIVESYLKIAKGKRGITFVVDHESAIETAAAFNMAGIPAQAVSHKTPDMMRVEFTKQFRAGRLLQLVNIDLFGEGYDVPAVEVVSMGRPSQSLSLVMQQAGRCLRPAEGKTHGIIIDHVGNILGPMGHGLPDVPRIWSLTGQSRKRKTKPDDVIPITSCEACWQPYEAFRKSCPHCGHVKTPADRSSPEVVDGDLYEVDPAVLDQLRRKAEETIRPWGDRKPQTPAEVVMKRNLEARIAAQDTLRECIAYWAGIEQASGYTDAESYRRFYLMFGVDVATAKTLNRSDAEKLTAKIREAFT